MKLANEPIAYWDDDEVQAFLQERNIEAKTLCNGKSLGATNGNAEIISQLLGVDTATAAVVWKELISFANERAFTMLLKAEERFTCEFDIFHYYKKTTAELVQIVLGLQELEDCKTSVFSRKELYESFGIVLSVVNHSKTLKGLRNCKPIVVKSFPKMLRAFNEIKVCCLIHRTVATSNVVEIDDVFYMPHESKYCYVMQEYAFSLQEALTMFEIHFKTFTLPVFCGILSGLKSFELVRYAHNGIKPHNIMLDKEGVVKIIDLESSLPIGEPLGRYNEYYGGGEAAVDKTSRTSYDLFCLAQVILRLHTNDSAELNCASMGKLKEFANNFAKTEDWAKLALLCVSGRAIDEIKHEAEKVFGCSFDSWPKLK